MEILNSLLDLISIKYIISVNTATYVILLLINAVTPTTFKLKTIYKRSITIVIGILLWYIYAHWNMITLELAIPSFFISIIIYDYLIKGIITKLTSKTDVKIIE